MEEEEEDYHTLCGVWSSGVVNVGCDESSDGNNFSSTSFFVMQIISQKDFFGFVRV